MHGIDTDGPNLAETLRLAHRNDVPALNPVAYVRLTQSGGERHGAGPRQPATGPPPAGRVSLP